jgi:predicted peroxiredoxin
MMFLTKEAARLAVPGVAVATACEGCPPLTELIDRYERAGGRYLVCPICVHAKKLDTAFIAGAEMGGTVPLWEWIGEEAATTFSF